MPGNGGLPKAVIALIAVLGILLNAVLLFFIVCGSALSGLK